MIEDGASVEDLGGDYTLVPVPADKRRHWVDVALVWMGMNICPPTLLLGVWLLRYTDFVRANLALLLGLAILSILSIAQGIIGNQMGLPTYPLSRLAFGDVGGRLFSALMFLSLAGWFGVLTETFVSTFYQQILPQLHVDLPLSAKPYVSFAFGLATTAICFYGFKAISWLNRLVIPGLLFLATFAVVKVAEQPHLLGEVLDWQPVAGRVPLHTAVEWVVGSLIIAAVTAPDFNRYCRHSVDTVYSVLLGNVPVVYFLTVAGMIFAVLSGAAQGRSAVEAADLSSVFVTQGWHIGPLSGGLLAVFILSGSIITTNVTNLYPGAMALVTLLKGGGRLWPYLEDRAVMTVVVGVAGSMVSAVGILEHFRGFLELLTDFAVPLVGIMSVDYFVLKNRDVKGRINLAAVSTWLLLAGMATVSLIPGGSLMTVIYSGALYCLFEKVKQRGRWRFRRARVVTTKQADGGRNEKTATSPGARGDSRNAGGLYKEEGNPGWP